LKNGNEINGPKVKSDRLLEHGEANWISPQVRSCVIADIEQAARIIERYLFRRIRTADSAIHSWRDERARMIANALREKEKRLLIPTANTREDILRHLSPMLVDILSGNVG